MKTKLAVDGGSPVRNRFLPFGGPALGEEEIDEVVATLRSGWIGAGPKVLQFEKELSAYVGAKHVLSTSSCTAGLHLSLIAGGIGPGDEVITTALTFGATANSVVHQGATPRFADIDESTLNLDVQAVERAITPKTKAIIPVHFGGLPVDLDAFRALARDRGLLLIEDAAHAIGARYKGRPIGDGENPTCFSFYANKNLTTAEGGAVAVNDPDLAEKIRVYSQHGLTGDAWKRYSGGSLKLSHVVVPGYKYNLTDLQASLGLHQLRKQEDYWEIRERYAKIYDAAFAEFSDVRRQPRPDGVLDRHALHLYILRIDPAAYTVCRNQIVEALLAENIGAAIHYRALHTHPYYAERFGYQPDDFPHAHAVGETIFSLPCTPGMSEDDVYDVIEGVTKVLSAYRR
ncbi:MAG: DegT/DnrJ/EryC1/StrS family aminotransferase [Bryobacterales bacterium]